MWQEKLHPHAAALGVVLLQALAQACLQQQQQQLAGMWL
jgi:hypothetical protein